jgi:hypothetical protein|eukprot:Tamp_18576.p1 GENE.Tamp_18576~~Tamp_18576.p1  ORF type:complete len:136 (-),score=17.88 Tamp_18576:507-914(-)
MATSPSKLSPLAKSMLFLVRILRQVLHPVMGNINRQALFLKQHRPGHQQHMSQNPPPSTAWVAGLGGDVASEVFLYCIASNTDQNLRGFTHFLYGEQLDTNVRDLKTPKRIQSDMERDYRCMQLSQKEIATPKSK